MGRSRARPSTEGHTMTEYECPVCGNGFGAAGAVRQHAWDTHNACHHCGDRFEDRERLYVHWLTTHDEALSKTDRKRAEREIGALTFRDRLTHQGPGAALGSLSRRKVLLGGGAALTSGVVAWSALQGGSDERRRTAGAGEGGTEVGATATEATFTTIGGEKKQLSAYRGTKVMLWVFATWCPSCQRGARALQETNETFQDVEILALKTHGNAGYSGPSVSEFAQQYAPDVVNADNWVWGDLSRESTRVWNPQNRPDIYFLIDEEGTIRAVSGAPAATINRIVRFAQGGTSDRPGKAIEVQPAEHVQPGQSHPPYNSNPPTSGWHYSQQAAWGFHSEELPDERVVHNLEHGGIWISYDNVGASIRSKLRQLAQEHPKSVIVTKRRANDAPVAVASWGRLMTLQTFDRQRILTFIEQNVNHSPEPIAGR